MENRKNTILLTVIAVATLLVAVVGATFAYFTAQGGDAVSKAVTVKTNTTDSALFNIGSAITLNADATQFTQAAVGTQIDGVNFGTTTATAEFQANDASTANVDFCYNVTLEIGENGNDFIKCADDTKCNAGEKPYEGITNKTAAELVFTAKKTAGSGTGAGTETAMINAMDITKQTTSVQIPNAAGTTNYEHKISAAPGVKVTDNWKFEVEFVNLDQDQNYNTGKTFNGSIKFTKVTCAGA